MIKPLLSLLAASTLRFLEGFEAFRALFSSEVSFLFLVFLIFTSSIIIMYLFCKNKIYFP